MNFKVDTSKKKRDLAIAFHNKVQDLGFYDLDIRDVNRLIDEAYELGYGDAFDEEESC